MANETIDKVRRTCGLKGKVGKRIRFKFLRNESNLTSEDRVKVESVLDRYSDLAVAYMIKESIMNFYSDMDISHARVMLRNVMPQGRTLELRRSRNSVTPSKDISKVSCYGTPHLLTTVWQRD